MRAMGLLRLIKRTGKKVLRNNWEAKFRRHECLYRIRQALVYFFDQGLHKIKINREKKLVAVWAFASVCNCQLQLQVCAVSQ